MDKGEIAALARVTGLEPATSGVTGRRSNQLSYTRSRPQRLEAAVRAVKPPPTLCKMVGGDGFEPPALSV